MNKQQRNVLAAAGTALALAFAAPAMAQDNTYSGSGKWENTANWSQGSVPTTGHTALIDGDADVLIDSETWNYLSSNSLLNNGTTGEYRFGTLRIANAGTDVATFDFGNGNVIRVTSHGLSYIGSGADSNGTVNLHSGTLINETAQLHLGEKEESTGQLNITGGAYVVSRATAGDTLSAFIGTRGNGTLAVSGGTLRTRSGVQLGSNGVFDVQGSGAAEIGIGSESSLDGQWVQNADGLLRAGVDAGGITPIQITLDSGSQGAGNVTFDNGALLQPYAIDDVYGTWTIMTWEGTLTDNGLQLAPGVDTSEWSFDVVGNELQVTRVPEPASLGLMGLGAAAMLLGRRAANRA